MDSDQPVKHVDAPLFFEALAAVAVCSPADAAEHYGTLEGRPWPLSTFFDEYVAHA